MWKLWLAVICLIVVVYGAPQAPPADEKAEPVKNQIFCWNLWLLNDFS